MESNSIEIESNYRKLESNSTEIESNSTPPLIIVRACHSKNPVF